MNGSSGHEQGQQRVDVRPYMTEIAELTEYFAAGNGSFEGYVPVTIVERDKVLPFREERTLELVEDLRATRERDGWGNGQDSPMLAAYILGQEVPTIEVYDGLHRQAANEEFQRRYGTEHGRPAAIAAAIGSTAVHFVTVKPMTVGDMLNKRLTNTKNHPQLRFARGGLWTAQLWYSDPISELAPNMSPKQAFDLAAREDASLTNAGANSGLSPDKIAAITSWARQKASEWSVDPSTVQKWIHRAESTSPGVIAQVRSAGKGRRAGGVVTEQMVTSLASIMGSEDLRHTHDIVVDYSLRHELSHAQFSHLLTLIMDHSNVDLPSDAAQVSRFLADLDPTELRTDAISRTGQRVRRRTDIFTAGAEAVSSVGAAIDRVAESLDVRDQKALFVPDVDQRRAAIAAAEDLERQAEKALELAERARRSASVNTDGRAGTSRDAVDSYRYVPAEEFDPKKYQNILTEREVEVLQLAASGLSNPALGRRLFIEEDTVKTHLRKAYRRLGAHDRAEAVVRAIQIGAVRIAGITPDVSPDSKKSRAGVMFAEQLEITHQQVEDMQATEGLQLSPEKLASLTRYYDFLGAVGDRITKVRSSLKPILSKPQANDPDSEQ